MLLIYCFINIYANNSQNHCTKLLTENIQQVLVPYPFILYWVTKKVIIKKSASKILHSGWLYGTVSALWDQGT